MNSSAGGQFCGSHTNYNPEAFRPWQTKRLLADAASDLVDSSTATWILDQQVVPGEILPPSQGETVHIIACPTGQEPYDWEKEEAQDELEATPQFFDWSKECPDLVDTPKCTEQPRSVSAGMPTVLGRSAMWPVAAFLNGLTPKDM